MGEPPTQLSRGLEVFRLEKVSLIIDDGCGLKNMGYLKNENKCDGYQA